MLQHAANPSKSFIKSAVHIPLTGPGQLRRGRTAMRGMRRVGREAGNMRYYESNMEVVVVVKVSDGVDRYGFGREGLERRKDLPSSC
jgi:hypothetical protein